MCAVFKLVHRKLLISIRQRPCHILSLVSFFCSMNYAIEELYCLNCKPLNIMDHSHLPRAHFIYLVGIFLRCLQDVGIGTSEWIRVPELLSVEFFKY